jgi:uncharacterized membrane protein YagU involved in acid resistance
MSVQLVLKLHALFSVYTPLVKTHEEFLKLDFQHMLVEMFGHVW